MADVVALTLKTSFDPQPDFLDLPWGRPLADWPAGGFVRFPAGLHRHVVRFLAHDGNFFALKELPNQLAQREYEMLEFLREQGLPAVTLTGIATERVAADGTALDDVLITRHLSYSLPYRQLFGGPASHDLRDKCIDALVVLLARAHLVGFFWGDCSLNNALFRRDAGALRAYLVDTETAERHEELTPGQRALDLEIGAENIAGGLLDLRAEGRLADDVDPAEVADHLIGRYEALWAELTSEEEVDAEEQWRIHARLGRLNQLGFDTEEVEISSSASGRIRFRPTVVEEGHHKRQLKRLTGIVAHENQARRLLAAINSYAAWLAQQEGKALPEALLAYRWLTERWEPTLAAIPPELRSRMEDAELYHQILEHRWYLSEEAGHDVGVDAGVASFVETVLKDRPDERRILETSATPPPTLTGA